MPEVTHRAYSYRDDANVPTFDDSRPLFVFDGICVLCSGGASWIMRHDPKARINFASAQSDLGQALYRHFGIEMNETYLLIDQGKPFTASDGYLQLTEILGGAWRLAAIFGIVPRRWRDAAYALVARNRYRWFGKIEYCALLTEEQRQRLLS